MIKSKIFVAVMLSVIALVLLVTASVAWFTISTNPEISGMQVNLVAPDRLLVSEDGSEGSWGESLNLSSSFEHYAPLKPVSTVDGLHWFLPEYNITGSLKDVNQFELDDSLKYANSMIYQKEEKSGEWVKLTGNALQEASNKGYYVYADFFLKTEEDATDVHLSFANPFAKSNSELKDTDGTYVLPAYELKEKEPEEPVESVEPGEQENPENPEEPESKYVIKDISNDTQNVVRVGFLINPVYGEDSDTNVTDITIDTNNFDEDDDYSIENYSKNKFYIYEPNADQRTSENKPITDVKDPTDRYIQSYDYRATKTTQGEGEEKKEIITPEDYEDGYYYETLPVKKTDIVETRNQENNPVKYKYEQTRVSPEYLIPQRYCEWNKETLLKTMEQALESKSEKWWSSNDVKYPYGSFLNSNTLYNGTTLYDTVFPGLQLSNIGGTGTGINVGKQAASGSGDSAVMVYPYDNTPKYSSSNTMITLLKDKPVRIRLFIWLEGQDIDCWNDVAAGGFVVNLELGGITRSVKPAAPIVKAFSNGTEISENQWTKNDVTFTVEPGDKTKVDHYIFTTNGKDWNEYIDETHTKIFVPGSYSIKFKAVSDSGVMSDETVVPTFNLVKTPDAEITFSDKKSETTGKYPVGTTVKAEIPDGTFSKKTMTILYSTDDGKNWSPYVEPLTMSEAGEYNYNFRTVESNTGSESIVTVQCYAETIEEP